MYDTKFMKVPEFVDPIKFAKLSKELKGGLSLTKLSRVSKLCVDNNGQVDFFIKFGFDANKNCCISGHYAAELPLTCQRCLERFTYNLVGNFIVTPVKSEAKAQELDELDHSYESVIIQEDGLLNLAELVEDELILGIPLVPMHPEGDSDCENAEVVKNLDESSIQPVKQSPFEVLKDLKRIDKEEG